MKIFNRSIVPSALRARFPSNASPPSPRIGRARPVHAGAKGTGALALIVVVALASLAMPISSWAGTGGAEFNSAYTTITNWLQGDLGRLLAASLLVVGLVMGVVRQSIMAAVPAIACGLVATVAPTIIGAVVTAVL